MLSCRIGQRVFVEIEALIYMPINLPDSFRKHADSYEHAFDISRRSSRLVYAVALKRAITKLVNVAIYIHRDYVAAP